MEQSIVLGMKIIEIDIKFVGIDFQEVMQWATEVAFVSQFHESFQLIGLSEFTQMYISVFHYYRFSNSFDHFMSRPEARGIRLFFTI